MRRTTLILLMILLGLTAWSKTGNRPVQNLVILCVDTVRYDSFWWPEESNAADALTGWTKKAVRVRRVQSTAPWTFPAVASVFTGLYPQQHGAGRLESPVADLMSQTPSGLSLQQETLAEVLTREGFYTAAFYAHPWFTNDSGLLQGFSEAMLQSDAVLIDSAKSHLRRLAQKKQRFFLYLHLMSAHDRHYSPLELILPEARSVAAQFPKLVEGEHYGRMSEVARVRYLRYMRGVIEDRQRVAELLQELSNLQMMGDTMIVLFSDHGEEFEDHLEMGKEIGLQHQGIGHGHSMFQELLHVPVLVWHPLWQDKDVEAPVSLVDLYPTIHHWLGVQYSQSTLTFARNLGGVQGINENDSLRTRPLFSTGIAYGTHQDAILLDNLKMISLVNGNKLFFRLDAALAEQTIASSAPPESVLRFFEDSLSLLARGEVEQERKSLELSPEELERLQAIGYLTGQ